MARYQKCCEVIIFLYKKYVSETMTKGLISDMFLGGDINEIHKVLYLECFTNCKIANQRRRCLIEWSFVKR